MILLLLLLLLLGRYRELSIIGGEKEIGRRVTIDERERKERRNTESPTAGSLHQRLVKTFQFVLIVEEIFTKVKLVLIDSLDHVVVVVVVVHSREVLVVVDARTRVESCGRRGCGSAFLFLCAQRVRDRSFDRRELTDKSLICISFKMARSMLTRLSTIATDQLTTSGGRAQVDGVVVERPSEQFAQLEVAEQIGAKEERKPLLSYPVE